MNVLVMGKTGQIGREVCSLLSQKNISFLAPSYQELDICDSVKVSQYIQTHMPTIVLNTVAYNGANKAENDPSQCFSVNRDAVAKLATICAYYDVILIHTSTYRVFDGMQQEFYAEDASTNPIGVLALSRLQAELQIKERCKKYIILRLSWIVSKYGNNLLIRLLSKMKTSSNIEVTSDQIGCPTPSSDIARVLVAIVQQIDCGASDWGVYHYCSSDAVSKHEFAEVIMSEASIYNELKVKELSLTKVSSQEGIRSKSPANAHLDCKKLLENFGIHRRSWRHEVTQILKDIFQKKQNNHPINK